MIYRIKIVKDGKFVRYANESEMELLRVNSNGIIEELCGHIFNENIIDAMCWRPVSATHEVEWGDMLPTKDGNGLALFDRDIYRDTNTDIIHVYSHRGDYLNKWNKDWGKNVVIGNVNENPELLEEA